IGLLINFTHLNNFIFISKQIFMALQLNDTGALVRKWQQFLKAQGFFADDPDGIFNQKTLEATKAFQKFYTIQQTGVAASLTLGKAYSLGFNPDNEPQLPYINNDQKMMQWIKDNLGFIIKNAVSNSGYSEDWLAGICARETGFLFTRYANQGFALDHISFLMKGDYGKRPRDAEKQYHGYGFWQIDIASFPAFINSGKWTDPFETAKMTVSVLEGKKNYLQKQGQREKLTETAWEKAITAAYNCGEGNVNKALLRKLDVDSYTFSKDYSKEVFRYRNIYVNL
ncbi:MAG: peptidoglycan-binding protein, partial [Ginsengibacter sp.]